MRGGGSATGPGSPASAGDPVAVEAGARAGVILPAALFLLLGGTLMAASLLVTARSAVLLSDGDRHLARALATRSPLAPPPGLARLPSGASVRGLGGGYVLVAQEVPGASWAVWAVGWRLDPDRVAAQLRAVVEMGRTSTGEGGQVTPLADGGGEGGEEGTPCEDGAPLPAFWLHGGARDPRPDPPLAPFPRLGPVGLDALVQRADVEVGPGQGFPDRDGILVAVRQDAPVEGGWASGLLVAPGELRLGGGTRFEGLVLAGGDLVLEEGAILVGAAGVGGEIRFDGGGRILGCRGIVRKNLESVDALEVPFPLPGGAFLGRH